MAAGLCVFFTFSVDTKIKALPKQTGLHIAATYTAKSLNKLRVYFEDSVIASLVVCLHVVPFSAQNQADGYGRAVERAAGAFGRYGIASAKPEKRI